MALALEEVVCEDVREKAPHTQPCQARLLYEVPQYRIEIAQIEEEQFLLPVIMSIEYVSVPEESEGIRQSIVNDLEQKLNEHAWYLNEQRARQGEEALSYHEVAMAWMAEFGEQYFKDMKSKYGKIADTVVGAIVIEENKVLYTFVSRTQKLSLDNNIQASIFDFQNREKCARYIPKYGRKVREVLEETKTIHHIIEIPPYEGSTANATQ